MKPRILTIIGLALLFSVSSVCLVQLDWGNRLSTDVMELIPVESDNPKAEAGRSILKDLYGNRVIIALFSVEQASTRDVYIETLKASSLVDRVTVMNDPSEMRELLKEVFRHRFELLLPDWLIRNDWSEEKKAGNLARRAAESLDSALDNPATLAYEEVIPSDPLLLSKEATEEALNKMPASDLEEGAYLLDVSLSVSTLSPEGQKPVIELLERAEETARENESSIEAFDTGAHRYAYETEQRMRQELKWLNVASALAVFIICGVFCRRWSLMLHIGFVVLLSVSAGLSLMSLLVTEMHIFALIFGSVLCGVIVDYTLHAYWHARHNSDSGASFAKPFLISCGSTLLGFALMLFSELPVVRQMGLMIVSCLLMAVWITPTYVFVLLKPTGKKGPTVSLKPHSVRPLWLGLGGLCLLPFLSMVTWKDDIRELKYPLPHLDAVDSKIRGLNGAEQEVWITLGNSYAESRERLEALHEWLQNQGVSGAQYFSATDWVPSYDRYLLGQGFLKEHPGFADATIDSLSQLGYDAEAFEPFRKDWSRAVEAVSRTESSYEELVQELAGHLNGSVSSLFGVKGELHWWLTIMKEPGDLSVPPADLRTVELNQADRLSNALGGFRERLLKLSLIGAVIVGLIVLLSFGLTQGGAVLWVPIVSVSLSSLITLWVAGSLNMFHLLGFFLGACLSLDYAVFTMTQAGIIRRLPFSVLVSSMTTGASFAVLSFSRIPAIHALGLSVLLVTLAGLLMSYFWVLPVALRKEANHGG